jgi:hypothetical protein
MYQNEQMNFTPRCKFKLTDLNIVVSKGLLKDFEPKGPSSTEQQIFSATELQQWSHNRMAVSSSVEQADCTNRIVHFSRNLPITVPTWTNGFVLEWMN